ARDRRRLFRTDQRSESGRHLQAGDRRTASPVSPRFFADGSRWQAPQAHRDGQRSRRHRARASILRGGTRTVRRTASPCLALVLLALVSLPRVAAAQSAPALRVDARSRSVAPGELVILTMTGDSAAIDNVRVTAFSKEIRAYRSADGTWQALVGIDLDQRP